ncbi:MAG: hypothetical protein CMM29_00805 [Rhodospirillaceae bacterium]|nr:hypothetical protein [Rhodospirillaceae bacterium]
MPRNNTQRILSATIGLCALAAFSAIAGEVQRVSDSWVRSAPPNVKMHAAYLTLYNHAATDVEIVGVESPQYERAEIHHSNVVDGVATMMKQDQIAIAPGGMLKMVPGGFHVMLIKPKQPVRDGDKIDLKFHFSDGTALTFDAEVRSASKPMNHDHGNHKQHKMN